MKNIKKLEEKTLQQITGGGDATCAIDTVGGYLGGGLVGGATGFLSSCVQWGNKSDWRNPTFKDPNYNG